MTAPTIDTVDFDDSDYGEPDDVFECDEDGNPKENPPKEA